ncbi:MAG: phosphoribosylaminoimidazolecarboxamide formyltransferase [Sphaerochaetaceae bacterium]|nr:phosphoribosylaminoimidazolecarboxamide formyltransferase [Sphaerochaetaceae bacterium]
MKLDLKYGCNPNQKTAYLESPSDMPIKVLNGRPGFINLMDALNGYSLVRELKLTTGFCAATSFKHVSPAGAAISAFELNETERKMYFVGEKAKLTPIASAYIRARGADRMASFGDFVALSDECDSCTASIIAKEVSDGIIAPSYSDEALEILKNKKGGNYLVLQIDSTYIPSRNEIKTIFGLNLVQEHNDWMPNENSYDNILSAKKQLSKDDKLDLTVALLSLKYTQSNSVCYVERGQIIGVGSGQQSRIACTRLAGNKADLWHLRHADKVLNLPFLPKKTRNDKDNIIEQYLADDPETDVVENWQDYFTSKPETFTKEEKKAYLNSVKGASLASDGFFPFRDNIDRAAKSGVSYVAEPGGSSRDEDIIKACDEHGMVLVFTGARLFHH